MSRSRFVAFWALAVLACDSGTESPRQPSGPTEPFTIVAFDRTRITSRSEEANFQRARAAIDWGKGPFASATLVVDLESPCYPFRKWRAAGAIPPGHRWPADCDAFDRTFTFHLLSEREGEPAVELVRAITPFGGPMHYEVDLTDVANGLPGPREIEVRIDTWPDPAGQVSGARGSWFVSARLEMVPGDPPRQILAVVPLFNGVMQGPRAGQPPIPFEIEVPRGATGGRIEYRATGHGGGGIDAACIGPADEFCERTHTILVDGDEVHAAPAWVECADNCDVVEDDPEAPFAYCAQNPCANHDSARAPRANWCPGRVTPPIVIEDPRLAAEGRHTVAFGVDRIGDGGSWTVSATYFAYRAGSERVVGGGAR